MRDTKSLVAAMLFATAPAYADDGDLTDVDARSSAPLMFAEGSPPELRFGEITAGGPGCPPGEYEVIFQEKEDGSRDERIFTIYYLSYKASISTADAYGDSACTLSVPVKITPGWQYAVTGFIYRGRASLATGMSGTIEASYGYMGAGALELSRQLPLSGPLTEERFEIVDTVQLGRLTEDKWSSCGELRTFVVTTSLNLKNGATRGVGYIRMTETSVSPTGEPVGTRARVGSHDFVPGQITESPSGASFRLGLRPCS